MTERERRERAGCTAESEGLDKGEQRDPAGKVSKELEGENVYVRERGREIQLHASCKESQIIR